MRSFQIKINQQGHVLSLSVKNWTEQAAKEHVCNELGIPVSAIKSCREVLPKIKTIDITAKEWDRPGNSGGGSYFGARVTINYGMPTEQTLGVRFQGGYGDHYKDMAHKELVNAGFIKNDDGRTRLWQFCQENKIILRTTKIERCKERECIEWSKVER